jgi:hypothetical protein
MLRSAHEGKRPQRRVFVQVVEKSCRSLKGCVEQVLSCTRKLSNIERRTGTLNAKVVQSPCYFTGRLPVTESVALPPPIEGSIMQKPYFLPDYVSASIHRPACPQCGALTMLARITPARVGFDFRTFECPQCADVHEVMVATEAFGRSFTPAA